MEQLFEESRKTILPKQRRKGKLKSRRKENRKSSEVNFDLFCHEYADAVPQGNATTYAPREPDAYHLAEEIATSLNPRRSTSPHNTKRQRDTSIFSPPYNSRRPSLQKKMPVCSPYLGCPARRTFASQKNAPPPRTYRHWRIRGVRLLRNLRYIPLYYIIYALYSTILCSLFILS